MAKTVYIGVGGVARKVKRIYVGVGGVARKVKKAFIGVDGVARLCYSSAPNDPTYTGSYNIVTNGNYRYMYLKTSGTLTLKDNSIYDFFLVGGGASGRGGGYVASGGGGGGYTKTIKSNFLGPCTIPVVIGSGGQTGNYSYPQSGGNSSVTINSVTSFAMGGSSTRAAGTPQYWGSDGGSGGAGQYGIGGSDGSNGTGYNYGTGQGVTTRAFAEAGNTLYAGGGSSPNSNYSSACYIEGGAGGGGAGIRNGGYGDAYGGSGTANTGGGGGAAEPFDSDCNGYGGAGGSGVVIIRWSIA